VTIKDLTMVNAPNYNISLLGADYVNIDGVTILNGYSDGIDPDCCHHVRISNCHIESSDDAIVPKASFSLGYRRSTENLTVTNCVLATNRNAFKLGTESGGDFRCITVSNCVMFARAGMRPPVSGISLLSVDGSHISDVTIQNIAMNGPRCPIFLRLGNRGRDMDVPVPGTLENILISQVAARAAEGPSCIAGIPGHRVRHVTLRDIRVEVIGGTAHDAIPREVPEEIAKYPSAGMFGPLPAYGLYCRHVEDLMLSNLQFTCASRDARRAIVFDEDCNNVNQGV
jgi:polygalacturonase